MASVSLKLALLRLVSIFANSGMTGLSDPDTTSHFLIPANAGADKQVENIFTSPGIRKLQASDTPESQLNQAVNSELAGIDGEGVALVTLQFPAGAVDPPHTNPYTAELLFLLEGTLEVGFVDTSNKLYNQVLQAGDMFVFPKGLVHFHYNPNTGSVARAVAAYGGFPGSASLPAILFATGVDDGILAQSFKTDVATIQKLKAGLASQA